MISPTTDRDKPSRDRASGALLLGGVLAQLLVAALHPTGHDVAGGAAARNVAVHAAAIGSLPLLFVGLLGLTRRLGSSPTAVLGLATWVLAAVAMLSAAVQSGFVATELLARLREAEPAAPSFDRQVLTYGWLVNQGFADVGVVAASVAMLLWSAAILRSGRLSRVAGAAGAVVGAAVVLAVGSGHVRLDVHGFAVVTLAQGAWLAWVGVLLLPRRPAPG
jgi:hypothetical protein